jgi:hypothetical protein
MARITERGRPGSEQNFSVCAICLCLSAYPDWFWHWGGASLPKGRDQRHTLRAITKGTPGRLASGPTSISVRPCTWIRISFDSRSERSARGVMARTQPCEGQPRRCAQTRVECQPSRYAPTGVRRESCRRARTWVQAQPCRCARTWVQASPADTLGCGSRPSPGDALGCGGRPSPADTLGCRCRSSPSESRGRGCRSSPADTPRQGCGASPADTPRCERRCSLAMRRDAGAGPTLPTGPNMGPGRALVTPCGSRPMRGIRRRPSARR